MSLVSTSLRARPPRLSATPAVHLLGNGRYSVWLTEAGMGRSSWRGEALSRWAGDRVEDADGWRFWLRDPGLGRSWPLLQPSSSRPSGRLSLLEGPGTLAWTQRDHGIESRVEVCVATAVDAELRTVVVRNLTARQRTLDVTGCIEIVLHDPAADQSHPAFSKLFVQTAWDEPAGALLASRRPRSPEEAHAHVAHALVGPGALEWETDRARFLGRNRPGARPAAMASPRPLSGTVGNVLDPVFAMRRRVDLAPGEEQRWTFVLAAAADRARALGAIHALSGAEAIDAACSGAQAAARETLVRLGLTPEEEEGAARLAGALLYGDPRLRAPDDVLRSAPDDAGARAALGIGAAVPIVVVRLDEPGGASALDSLARALGYWRHHGIDAALVAIGGVPERGAPVRSTGRGRGPIAAAPRTPGVFLADGLDAAARRALEAGAAIVARDGTRELLDAAGAPAALSTRAPQRGTPPSRRRGPRRVREALRFDNGYGGFSADGREYVIRLDPLRRGGHRRPPLPWTNVIANPGFGTIVSESGASCTWSGNSREHRLTPWSNDPLADPHGEALYVQDDDSGVTWSPLPGPLPHAAAYEVRHALGTSSFRLVAEGLEQETVVGVDAEAPVKLVRVRLTNRGEETRALALISFTRLVLGASERDARRVVTERAEAPGALLARNPAAGAWREAVAFSRVVTTPGAALSWTTDREAFLGRHGDAIQPAAVASPSAFDGVSGAVHDPCFAWRVAFELPPGASREVTFVLGEGADAREAAALIGRFAQPRAAEDSLAAARAAWDTLVSRVQVETPVPELDLMLNAWLPYQTMSCRLWGRSAFYQSGGAFGFRDQLQDALSLTMLAPERAREQVLLHARHQFVEGDVLHWWHPPGGAPGQGAARGMRTRFADDRLWLPWLAATYVLATGDRSVLDEPEPFLRARALAPGEDEAYLEPAPAGATASVFEHAARAIDCSLAVGAHGLPLFGCGDWNDGMNRVGREGRGESVWMGWFLVTLLPDWIELAERRGEEARAARWKAHRERLVRALETEAWDGEWYRRGWYDDGSPLGSRQSDECRIDALAQAWAVFSGVAPRERTERAMASLESALVSEPERLIRLLAPPFQDTPHDPGYIKGYVAGVRENGGQYTHAALWVVRALAELGRRDRAARLLTMLSPVSHAADAEHARRYKVEPYVVAADVYGVEPHVGRGGWTWYTGSSGWMYRVALESVLGVRVERGSDLVVEPCIPDDWPGFRLGWRVPGAEGTRVELVVRNPERCSAGVVSASYDGGPLALERGLARAPLPRDGAVHRLEVVLGRARRNGSR